MILGLTGPEGAGKSAAMAYVCLNHYFDGGTLWTFPGYDIYDPRSNKKERRKISKPLPLEDWVGMGEELQDALIAIDEIQNFFDALRFASTLNKLFTSLATQRRKRELGIVYTIQNQRWVDNRVRWLTHVVGTCYDLHWSDWGREEQLKRGELMSVSLVDEKGFYTGAENTPLGQITLQTRELWECFDSYAVISPWEGFTKIKIDRPELHVGFGGGVNPGAPAENPFDPEPPTPRGMRNFD